MVNDENVKIIFKKHGIIISDNNFNATMLIRFYHNIIEINTNYQDYLQAYEIDISPFLKLIPTEILQKELISRI